MTKPVYTIAVTGLNATDNPGPGLAVIRALQAAESFGVRIIGLSYEALEPGIYLRKYVYKVYSMPYPAAGQEALFERIAYINGQENIDFLFPNFDAELYNFIRLGQRFEQELGIKMFLPTLEQFDARHKVTLYDFGQKHDLKVPKARAIYAANEIPPVSTQLGFPIVVKGKFYDAKIAYNNEQAAQHFNRISSQWGMPILLQEFVHGSEVNVCGIGDGEGNLIGAVPMRKLYITDKGKAWAGVSIDDEKLLETTRHMVARTKWRGAFEMELIKTVDDEYYLIEINPRFPAWCYLTVGAGQNQVEAMVRMAMGEVVPPFTSFKVGTLFIRYSEDLVVDIKEFEKISTIGEL